MVKFATFLNSLLSKFGLVLHRTNSGFWDEDKEFLKIYREIKDRTLVKIDRCYSLYQYAKHAQNLDGEAAQVGVYKGGTAKMIAKCFPKKKFYLFDTFEGLPTKEELFADVDVNEIKEYFKDCQNVEIRKGLFPGTASDLTQKKFSFVYLDADIYESTRDGIDFFYPRLVPGGIILSDDYKTKNWPGIEKAFSEASKKYGFSVIRSAYWQGLIIKN